MASAVTPESRTDAQIQADVLADLKWDPRIQANEIGVTVKDGVVTLTGRVIRTRRNGRAQRLNGTPTFFVNSVRYDGPRDADSLTAALQYAAQLASRPVTRS